MSEENRLILAEKYYTKRRLPISDDRLAELKNMKVYEYRKLLVRAQYEFSTYYCPLDEQLEAECRAKEQKAQEERNKEFEVWLQMRREAIAIVRNRRASNN